MLAGTCERDATRGADDYRYLSIGQGRLLFNHPLGEVVAQRLTDGAAELLAVVDSPQASLSNGEYLFVAASQSKVLRFAL